MRLLTLLTLGALLAACGSDAKPGPNADPDVDPGPNPDPVADVCATLYVDADGDGFGVDQREEVCEATEALLTAAIEVKLADGWARVDTDCDDDAAAVNPGASEVCNSIDDDCDAAIDDADDGVELSTGSTFYADGDGDGYGDPGAPVIACAASVERVVDGTDCDDDAAAVNPGASEVCNSVDDDCDAAIDDADSGLDLSTRGTFYVDGDGDGYGDPDAPSLACSVPLNHVDNDADCDDNAVAIHPAATEICDGVDNNCNKDIDDVDATLDLSTRITFFADTDTDGYGNPLNTLDACALPSGYISDDTDCDDSLTAVHPGAAETCDGTDSNCSGDETDASDVVPFYADADGDGFGDALVASWACVAPSGYLSDDTDCDDSLRHVYPGAIELCDGLDTDCNLATGEAGRVSYHLGTSWTDVTQNYNFSTTLYNAVDGGELNFCAGNTTAVFWSEVDLSGSVTINGFSSGSGKVVFSGNQSFRAFTMAFGANASFNNITIQSGRASEGAGVSCFYGNLTLNNVKVLDNHTTGPGGGLYTYNCYVTVTDSLIQGNSGVNNGGGIYADSGSLVLDNTQVFGNALGDNTAAIQQNGGGGLYAIGLNVDLINGTLFKGNTAYFGKHDGGGAQIVKGDLLCQDASFHNNGWSGVSALNDYTWGTAAVRVIGYGTMVGDNCDMGDGSNENYGGDVRTGAGLSSPYGVGAVFSCTESGCSP